MSRDPLGGPTGIRKPSLLRAKFSFKKAGLGLSKKKGRWVVSFRPNRLKGLKKGLAHASLLGLPSSKSREFKTELPKPVFVGESSEQEAPLLDQGHSASSLKSYMLGMFPSRLPLGRCPRNLLAFLLFLFREWEILWSTRSQSSLRERMKTLWRLRCRIVWFSRMDAPSPYQVLMRSAAKRKGMRQ